MENRIAQWAERLRTAEEHKAPIDPLREEIGEDADGSIAYAIQSPTAHREAETAKAHRG